MALIYIFVRIHYAHMHQSPHTKLFLSTIQAHKLELISSSLFWGNQQKPSHTCHGESTHWMLEQLTPNRLGVSIYKRNKQISVSMKTLFIWALLCSHFSLSKYFLNNKRGENLHNQGMDLRSVVHLRFKSHQNLKPYHWGLGHFYRHNALASR